MELAFGRPLRSELNRARRSLRPSALRALPRHLQRNYYRARRITCVDFTELPLAAGPLPRICLKTLEPNFGTWGADRYPTVDDLADPDFARM